MKKIILIMVACLMMISSSASAKMDSISVTELDKIVGEWYDSKGNLAMTIGSDYTINGCKVVAAYYDPDLGGYFGFSNRAYRIAENNGYIDIKLDHGGEGYHEILIVDGKNALRRTKEPKYFESIGGIYIGMDKDDVLKLYGQPSSINNEWRSIWNYNNDGFSIVFMANIVCSVTIYKNSDRRFDWSGLSANDLKMTFENKYNTTYGYTMRGLTKSILVIEHGEQISFLNKDSITLLMQGDS